MIERGNMFHMTNKQIEKRFLFDLNTSVKYKSSPIFENDKEKPFAMDIIGYEKEIIFEVPKYKNRKKLVTLLSLFNYSGSIDYFVDEGDQDCYWSDKEFNNNDFNNELFINDELCKTIKIYPEREKFYIPSCTYGYESPYYNQLPNYIEEYEINNDQ